MTNKGLTWAVAASVFLSFANQARAQATPSRPITVIVPYAAGGSADVLPRRIAEHMQATLGKPVVALNVPGAAGTIGAGRIARATPDGYTFGLGTWSTHVANAVIYPLQYDVIADFEPIALIASSALVVVARKGVPARDLKELVAWLKADPDRRTQGTNGSGSVMHLAGRLLQQETNSRFQFVPYRGAAQVMPDLVGGHIDLYLGLPADVLPHVRAHNIQSYAVLAASRLLAAPEIPTVNEAGIPGLYVSAWFGFWAPRGTPRDALDKLNDATVRALADSNVSLRLKKDLVLEIPPRDRQTPEALTAFQKSEVQKWWPIIKSSNIKPE